MATSIYMINKGVNRSIELKGLKAQYIWYLAIGLVALMVLFSILYIIGIHPFICMGVIGGSGTFMVMRIYAISNKYGEFGMLKKLAGRRVPKVVRLCSREVFMFGPTS